MRGTFLRNYFEIGPLAWEMSFKGFFLFLALAAILFSGAEPFRQFWSRGMSGTFCEIILKSGHWPGRRCRLKVFLLLALAATLFSGAEPFRQF